MANALLDFVMSLARDPAAAARYAADPAKAIDDAHLTGITSADVDSLLPMVSDSLSMSSPVFAAFDVPAGNVWTGTAATAALNSFTAHDPPAGDLVHREAVGATEHRTVRPAAGEEPTIHDREPIFDASSQSSGVSAEHPAIFGDTPAGADGDPLWGEWAHGAVERDHPSHLDHGYGGHEAGAHGFEMLD